MASWEPGRWRAVLAAACLVLAAATASSGLTVADAAAGTRVDQPNTWNFSQARVPGAQARGRDGAGATVAVVDTWVDYSHPDFGGRVIDHALCIDAGRGCRARTYSPDACTHGTHVAGTAASARYGVAPKATVIAVQVLSYHPDTGCSGTASDVAAGIRYAVANGADVINLSLGTLVPGLFQSEAVTDAVHEAARAGAVVVFAAGNSGLPLTDSYGSNALIIAATGPDGDLASYSGRGSSVALAAPGGDSGAGGMTSCRDSTCVKSTVPDSKYRLMQGTSMAAPHVSGVATLLVAQIPQRGRADVVASLQSTARPLSGTRHGLLNATAALQRRTPAQGADPSTGGQATPPPNTSKSASPTRASAASAPTPGQQPPASPNTTPPAESTPPTTGGGTPTAGPGATMTSSPADAQPADGASPGGFPRPWLMALGMVAALGAVWLVRALTRARDDGDDPVPRR